MSDKKSSHKMDTFRKKFGLDALGEATNSTTINARNNEPVAINHSGRLYPTLDMDDAAEERAAAAASAAASDPTPDATSDVKHRLRSMWHNVKYGKAAWTLQDNGAVLAADRGPVWVMGRCYDRRRGRDRDEDFRRQVKKTLYSTKQTWGYV